MTTRRVTSGTVIIRILPVVAVALFP